MKGCEVVVKMVLRINTVLLTVRVPFNGNISKVASQVVMCDVTEMDPDEPGL